MRDPDLTIGPLSNPYMKRWHLKKWRGWQLALHKICRSDDDRALHDHTAWNLSILLWGTYRELLSDGRQKLRFTGMVCGRRATTPHRLVLNHGPVWTIWLRGPAERRDDEGNPLWGFHCPKGFVHWKKFTRNQPGVSEVGAGCGD
jgi:hypothetical protein